ncbi:MAG: SpaA isopeptide-forming pilin-related protein, partial [Erysipelotrichales bacterium]
MKKIVRYIMLAFFVVAGSLTSVNAQEKIADNNMGALKIKNTAQNNINLEGSQFEVIDKNGNVVKESLITKKTGTSSTVLKAGNYALKQTKAAKGFDVIAEEINFTIKSNNWTEVTVKNNYEKPKFFARLFSSTAIGKLNVNVLDSKSNAELEGATFEIYNSNGEKVDQATTNNKGSINLENIDVDTYYLKMTAAPKGYSAAQRLYTAQIEENSNYEIVALLNKGEKDAKDIDVLKEIKKSDDNVTVKQLKASSIKTSAAKAVNCDNGCGFISLDKDWTDENGQGYNLEGA